MGILLFLFDYDFVFLLINNGLLLLIEWDLSSLTPFQFQFEAKTNEMSIA
jgi:hypothetical protein